MSICNKEHARLRLCLCLLLLCAPLLAQARPDLSQATAPGVFENGSAYYRFEQLRFDSDDQQRHYRVRLAVPRRPAPESGYPVLYLLDGNAALEALQEDWLAEQDARGPAVLVLIGYDTDLRFDLAARTFDYTPAPAAGEVRQPASGGAADFLRVIEARIKPWVYKQAFIDPRRQSLWGHSYGGLFVLDTLFTRPELFQTYIAVSPSLWWASGQVLQAEQSFRQRRLLDATPAPVRLSIMSGREERAQAKTAPLDPVRAERLKAMAAVPEDASRSLVERLRSLPGITADYREFPGLGHGPMLAASLLPALRLAAGSAVQGDSR